MPGKGENKEAKNKMTEVVLVAEIEEPEKEEVFVVGTVDCPNCGQAFPTFFDAFFHWQNEHRLY